MPKAKKTTTRKKTTKQKKFSPVCGHEFFTRVMNGAKRIFSPKY